VERSSKTLGINGRVSANRLLPAFKTTIAIRNPARCCWKERLVSIVMNTSYCPLARVSSSPFFRPAHPIRGTESTICPDNSRRSRQSRFSSSRILTSGGSQEILARSFEQRDDLLAPDARKPLKKVIDGLPSFEVSKQALHRYARAGENRRATEDFGIRMQDIGEILNLHFASLPESHRRG
jgi:hypothetical protein